MIRRVLKLKSFLALNFIVMSTDGHATPQGIIDPKTVVEHIDNKDFDGIVSSIGIFSRIRRALRQRLPEFLVEEKFENARDYFESLAGPISVGLLTEEVSPITLVYMTASYLYFNSDGVLPALQIGDRPLNAYEQYSVFLREINWLPELYMVYRQECSSIEYIEEKNTRYVRVDESPCHEPRLSGRSFTRVRWHSDGGPAAMRIEDVFRLSANQETIFNFVPVSRGRSGANAIIPGIVDHDHRGYRISTGQPIANILFNSVVTGTQNMSMFCSPDTWYDNVQSSNPIFLGLDIGDPCYISASSAGPGAPYPDFISVDGVILKHWLPVFCYRPVNLIFEVKGWYHFCIPY